jgi:hypothetical protein
MQNGGTLYANNIRHDNPHLQPSVFLFPVKIDITIDRSGFKIAAIKKFKRSLK